MILMSKYKGQHGGKKGQKIRAWVDPPPLHSGNARKKTVFFPLRPSLNLGNACILGVSGPATPPLPSTKNQKSTKNHPKIPYLQKCYFWMVFGTFLSLGKSD